MLFIDLFWNMEDIPTLPRKELYVHFNTWFGTRMIQCVGKQVSGIVRGTRKKQEKRLKQIETLNKKGFFKQARHLQVIYDKVKVTKPDIKAIYPELDERFIKMDFDNQTSFDGFITLYQITNTRGFKLSVPVKKTKHFNEMLLKGTLKKGIRLGKNDITFNFEIPEPELKPHGDTIGIDIGKTDLISCSNGTISHKTDNHGHSLNSIIAKLSRKVKGSKNFEQCQIQREQFINWSINQLNIPKNVSYVNIENLKNVRKYKKSSRTLSHWIYPHILDKIESKCCSLGVRVNRLDPVYTSQRCSKCGWVCKRNRYGKKFKCTSCGYAADADLNASINLSLYLPPIGEKKRLKHFNIKGFYWNVSDKESIVPYALKMSVKLTLRT